MIILSIIASIGLISADPQVPPVMYEFMGQMYRLQPFMFSNKEFNDPKKEASIKEALTNLSKISERLPHNQRLSTTTFQVTANTLRNHLQELSTSFSAGRKEYARRLLLATLDGCSSCHTQVPGRTLPQWGFRDNELKGSDFDKGEFLFAVRHYKEALTHFSNFVKNYNPKIEDALQLETALKRILVIYVRVLRDPQGGIKALEPAVGNKALPKHIRTTMKGWIDGLKKLSRETSPDALKASQAEVTTYATKTIAPLLDGRGAKYDGSSFVLFLAASGLIYDFINNRPEKDLSPELLRMLAQCDSQISSGYFFSMTDNYLRECIIRFPESETAKNCYRDLEASVEAAYTGSSGTHLPADVTKELQGYRKLLKI